MSATPTRPQKGRPASAGATPTQFIKTRLETYAYRRSGGGSAPPIVCLQHFTGTPDNWDPASKPIQALLVKEGTESTAAT